jgi:predicted lipoprotein with Yx(FWY)xxD motif
VRADKSGHRCRRGLAAAIAGAASCLLAGCGDENSSSTNTTAAPVTGQAGTVAAPVALKAVYMAQFRAKVLVDGSGYSLYVFGPDRGRAVTCTATCALSWPPLTIASGAKPTIGRGVDPGLVSSISSPGGMVVTYSRWPLYTYVADVNPGMASGEAINLNGGPWYLMRANGDPLVPSGQPRLLGAPRDAE